MLLTSRIFHDRGRSDGLDISAAREALAVDEATLAFHIALSERDGLAPFWLEMLDAARGDVETG